MKLGMYIQSENAKNQTAFDKAMKQVKSTNVDVVIIQDGAYVPFAPVYKNGDIMDSKNQQKILAACSDLSDRLGKAVVVGGKDKNGNDFVIFANAAADFGVGEEEAVFYLGHIGCEKSVYGMDEYRELAYQMLYPLLFKGLRFGLLKNKDIEYSAFGRIYGLEGMDLLMTMADGKEVETLKAHARARAVENGAVSLILGTGEESVPYVYGPDGSELVVEKPFEDLYTCVISDDPLMSKGPEFKAAEKAEGEVEKPVTEYVAAHSGEKVAPGIWKIAAGESNVIALELKNEEILLPEKVLPLVYSGESDEIENRMFVMAASVDKEFSGYNNEAIEDILKSRVIENNVALILETAEAKKCYLPQADGTVTVKDMAELDMAADLASYKGALDIWEKREELKEEWLDDYTWLIETIQKN